MAARVPVSISIGEGPPLAFEVEAGHGRRACLALGVRKSGSSVFSSIVGALAGANGVNVVDIPGTMFHHRHRYPDWNGHSRLPDLLWRGNAYIGFRDAPTGLYGDPVFREARKMLLVRDPRDALVSEYFSNAYSHSLPGPGEGRSVIDEEREAALASGLEPYVLGRVEYLNRTVSGYAPLVDDPNTLVARYEDVVFDKGRWIRDIARHFEWEASDELVGQILGWADLRPAQEDPGAFVRRVTPGDHLEKLSPATVSALNRQLSAIWSQFGYAIGD